MNRCSLVAGLVAATVSAPADIVKTRVMGDYIRELHSKSAQRKYKGALHCFITVRIQFLRFCRF